jgi:NitT/TauT family transport system substrate-binding protein
MKKATLIFLLLFALAACRERTQQASSTTAQPATRTQQQDITISQFSRVFIYLPLYVAVEKGFFSENGLRVHLVEGGGDEKTFAAVASGQAQFGVADPTFAAIAREKGQPGLVVASVVSGVPFWGVTKNPKIQKIDKPEGLRDLRIATYTAPSTNYTLMATTLVDNRDRVGKARIVQGTFGSLLAMLDAGAADVAMELEPTVSIAEQNGARVVYSYPEAYGPYLLTGMYTKESYAREHPDVVQRAVNALEKAMRYSHADPEGAVAVAKKVFPELDEKVIRVAVHRMLDAHTIPEHAVIDQTAWSNAVKVRIKAGDLRSEATAAATIDKSFAQNALQQVK